jgi:hypothetical protein
MTFGKLSNEYDILIIHKYITLSDILINVIVFGGKFVQYVSYNIVTIGPKKQNEVNICYRTLALSAGSQS